MYCHKFLHWQDKENGGISDRPDNAVDIYHTYFGVAGIYTTSSHSIVFNHRDLAVYAIRMIQSHKLPAELVSLFQKQGFR